ncbi:MAG: hypothetical protein HKP61_04470 [Dactylosporangium sp.]|nr:hypothetical protein [Dactylosporangium sp.]
MCCPCSRHCGPPRTRYASCSWTPRPTSWCRYRRTQRWFPPVPRWAIKLQSLTRRHPAVQDCVLGYVAADGFFSRLEHLLTHPLPARAGQDMARMTVAVGCTADRQRPVASAERIGRSLRELGYQASQATTPSISTVWTEAAGNARLMLLPLR